VSHTVVIVGAGQAGLQTAVSLRQGGFEGRVVLLGDEPHLPYQRPPLSKQVLKSEWDADRCTLRQQTFLDEHGIDFRPGVRAEALDAQRRQLTLANDRILDYDDLVVATGASLNRIALSGSALRGVHYLRTIDDALALRDALNEASSLVVAGGGYIGLEVAASARSLGCAVNVIEAQPHIMQRSALKPVADALLARHREAGVTFHLGRLLTEIHGAGQVQAVSLDDGTLIDANIVLKGLGVRPAVEWLEGSGVATDRGVLVDAACRTNQPHVFAAGDCAETRHPLYEGSLLLESVQNAVSQGKLCAAAILGEDPEYTEVPWFWSEQYDARLQMAGIAQEGDELVLRDSGPNALSVLSLGADRLNAIQCINAPKDYMAARKIIAARDAIDLDQLRNPETQLKDLL
jgi:3-phenylpropionate/trans-cinnamate dioxygenase ferredoxin reductase subunit